MSDIKRLIDLSRTEAGKIRARQKAGAMKEYYDEENYLCYSIQLQKRQSRKKTSKVN